MEVARSAARRRQVAGLPYASVWRRTLAFLIDELVAKTLFYAVLVLPLIMMTGSVAVPDFNDPLTLLPQFLLGYGYDWIFWGQGWTPGGRLLRLRVVTVDGAVPGLRRGGVRATVALIPVAALFFGPDGPEAVRAAVEFVSSSAFVLGHVWMLWDARKQTWHDKAAGTFVVVKR